MNIEEIRDYCLSKAATTEDMPFGDDILVFKVAGKMFLLANLNGPLRVNLKALPEDVADRLERFPEALPGYHMNKRHWVTVDMEAATDFNRIKLWIDQSYLLVVQGLPGKHRKSLGLI